MPSPTQRSLKHLREEGWEVAIVEKWNQFSKQRQDLFGFADLLAMRPGEIAAIQVTSTGVAARRKKILAEPRALDWILAGGTIYIHGWRKLKQKKKDGTYSKVAKYTIREEEVIESDFDPDALLAGGAASLGPPPEQP